MLVFKYIYVIYIKFFYVKLENDCNYYVNDLEVGKSILIWIGLVMNFVIFFEVECIRIFFSWLIYILEVIYWF